MKKKLHTPEIVMILLLILFFGYPEMDNYHHMNQRRAKHKKFLENSPFKKTLSQSKEERKTLGIPPNKYYERQWELSMNPDLGYPEPYKIAAIQKNRKNSHANKGQNISGNTPNNPWIERGPNNVGGRTRVVFFDPNDDTHSRVYAGAVSGGLWVTEDITTNGGWTQVSGLPGNLNVSCYAIDPTDSNTWYIGTGEQYTSGDATGNGLYRTTDGGITWSAVPIQLAGQDTYDYNDYNTFVAGVYYINDIMIWNNGGAAELLVGVGASVYRDSSDPRDWLGLQSSGLYRSVDNGEHWNRIEAENMEFEFAEESYYYIPNDFEVTPDNIIWMTTVGTPGIGGANGQIYSSVDGINWIEEFQVPNGRRIEIEASAYDPAKLYVLAQTFGLPVLYVTDDAFASDPESLPLPIDPDGSIPSSDFTRGQSFYDLVIEADPEDDLILYVGGINVHRSIDGGMSWNTISHWSSYWSSVGSRVHADQHALTFVPGNSNQAVLGHDGGVSFASDLSAEGENLTAIYDVDNGYNVTQFYHMGVAPVAFSSNSFLAGAQDNGTQYFFDANPTGPDSASDISGGDGAYSFYDQVETSYLITNYVYNNGIDLYDFNIGEWRVIASNGDRQGDFINPQALDSHLDILYSNGATGEVHQLFRYENLTSLEDQVPATRTVLTDTLLNDVITAMEISPYTTTESVLIVGLENGRLLRVENAEGVPVWSDITGPSFIGSISDVQFGQTEDTIFVTFHNYGVTSIWYTDDGGVSWQNKEGTLPDLPVKCIMQNPLQEDEVIIGTDLGIWSTSNFSASVPEWISSYNGMSDVKVTDIQLRDDYTVFVATHGRGVFSGQFTAVPLSVENENLITTNAMEVRLYPAISDGEITITSTVDLGTIQLDVYTLSGQKVYTTEVLIAPKSSKIVHFNTLASGVYLLNFNNETRRFTRKFIIK